MLERIDETIVAVSSAPGSGALGLVRLSGAGAIVIADSMSDVPGGLGTRAGSTWAAGRVVLEAGLRLPARFYVFKAPHSYTSQDMVEIHAPGCSTLLYMLCKEAIERGALPAEPGEFTARAFLNGGIDLAEAEAVAALIRAQSDTQLRAARRMMEGSLTRRINRTTELLADLVALVEADIDFSEEPIEFITPDTLCRRLEDAVRDLRELLAGAVSMERLESLPRILLLGPPNTGKSSLINALSGTDRAICAAAAGTTRDVLSIPVKLGRGEAIMLDAAGVDQHSDELAARARAMTLSTAEQVDLVCVVVDMTDPGDSFVGESLGLLDMPPVVIAANKRDLVPEEHQSSIIESIQAWEMGSVCPVSALRGTGLDDLRQALADNLEQSPAVVGSESIIMGQRQRSAVTGALEALRRATDLGKGASETIDCADTLAFELREALENLGSVTGEITTEDLLHRIFENFCIGK